MSYSYELQATTCMNLENNILSETSPSQKTPHGMILFYKMSRTDKSTKAENRLVVTRA